MEKEKLPFLHHITSYTHYPKERLSKPNQVLVITKKVYHTKNDELVHGSK